MIRDKNGHRVMDDFELKAWIHRLGSVPIKNIVSEDFGGAFEIDRCTIFQLENKKYAAVFECGCSCYSVDDARIDLFPTKIEAMAEFSRWKRSRISNRTT